MPRIPSPKHQRIDNKTISMEMGEFSVIGSHLEAFSQLLKDCSNQEKPRRVDVAESVA